MNRKDQRIVPVPSARSHESEQAFRCPRFECHEQDAAVDLEVFVPGVEQDGVEMELERDKLVVTAHKTHPVLGNWQPANLGAQQRDYQLRIRLPRSIDPTRIWGVLKRGVLKIHLRKSQSGMPVRIRLA